MTTPDGPVSPARQAEIARRGDRRPALLTALALTLILLGGFVLRASNLNWDAGQHLHPDERFLSIVASQVRMVEPGEYFDSARSPLNPYNQTRSFVYGTLPLFVTKATAGWLKGPDAAAPQVRAAATAVGIPLNTPQGTPAFDDLYDANLPGRLLSALVDTATILLVFLAGWVLFRRDVGLAAAAVYAVTPLAIQYAHFFGSEPWVVFFGTAVLLFSALTLRRGSPWWLLAAGVCAGLALGSKLNAFPLLLLPVLAVGLRTATTWREPGRWRRLALAGGVLVLTGSLAFGTFRVVQPYAFEGPGLLTGVVRVSPAALSRPGGVTNPASWFALSPGFQRDLQEVLRLQTNEIDFPPALQWAGQDSLALWSANLVQWGFGWWATLLGGVGAVVLGLRVWRRADPASLFLLAWLAISLWFVGRGVVVTLRYFLPSYPALAILAGVGFVALWTCGPAVVRHGPRLLRRAFASPWPSRLAKASAVVLLGGAVLYGLTFHGVYREEHSRVAASRWLAATLPAGAVVTSVEWDDGLPLLLPNTPLPAFSTVQLKPFMADDAAKVAELITGLDQADYVIESSNRAYGQILRLPDRYPATSRYYQALFDGSLGFRPIAAFSNPPSLGPVRLDTGPAEEAFSVYDHPTVLIWQKTPAWSVARAQQLLATDTRPIRFEEIGKTSVLDPDRWTAQQAAGTWSDVFSTSPLATTFAPVTWYLWVSLLGLVALPWLLRLMPRWPALAWGMARPLGLLAIALGAWWLASLGWVPFSREVLVVLALAALVPAALLLRHDLASLRQRGGWRGLLGLEALALGSFLVFLLIRALNPDMWHPFRGGEKPMDLAILNAVARSATFPPYDAWFAGGSLNYYYFGQLLVASVMRVTGTPVEWAVNLAVPLWWSFLAAGAWVTGHSLVRLLGTHHLWRMAPVVGGSLALFLVAVAGNLDGIAQLGEQLTRASRGAFAGIPLVGQPLTLAAGFAEVATGQAALTFDYWRSSRQMPPTPNITEFPFWTFLFADPHAHLFALPFTVAMIGLALVRLVTRQAGRILALAMVAGLVLGLLRATNTWDFPSYAALYVAAVLGGWILAWRGGPAADGPAILRRALTVAGEILLVLAASSLLFWPFHASYQLFYAGILPAPDRTLLDQYLAVNGILLFFAGSLLAVLAWRAIRMAPLWPAIVFGLVAGLAVMLTILRTIPPVTALGVVLATLAAGIALAGLVRRQPGWILAGLMAGLAAATAAAIEFVTVEGDIGRMNTVFRFYLQAWVLWGLLGGAGGATVLAILSRSRRPTPVLRLAGSAWLIAAGVFLATALVFPVLGTAARIGDRFQQMPPTLDGFAYMPGAVFRDQPGPIALGPERDLVRWFRESVPGTPVVLEAQTPTYRWGSRIAVATGLPAVVGWDWHQRQQRWGAQSPLDQRIQDVALAYSTPSPEVARRILDRYGVRYVVVGQVERLYYPPGGLAKFASMPGLRPVYQDGTSTVYEVLPLPSTASAPVTP